MFPGNRKQLETTRENSGRGLLKTRSETYVYVKNITVFNFTIGVFLGNLSNCFGKVISLNNFDRLFLSVAHLDIEISDGIEVPDADDTNEKRGAPINSRLWPRDENNNLKIRYSFASNCK